MLKEAVAFFAGLLATVTVSAESITAPVVKPGDKWIYKSTVDRSPGGWTQTHTEFTVIRVSPDVILLSIKEHDSALPPKEQLVGLDWSRFRNVNGEEKTVNRPLAFPLTEGKSWEIEYTENQPNKQHKSEQFHSTYHVTGWEDIEVPAGRFKAVRIETDGWWKAELAPANTTSATTRTTEQGATVIMQNRNIAPKLTTGRLYKAFWYVPEVKRWVKSVEEYYNSGGLRNERYETELESFNVSN